MGWSRRGERGSTSTDTMPWLRRGREGGGEGCEGEGEREGNVEGEDEERGKARGARRWYGGGRA